MKILRSNDREQILEYVKHLLWDKQTIKELGEPIIFSDSQTWLLGLEGHALVGFFVYEEKESQVNIQYMYVYPELRRLKVAESLYSEFEQSITVKKPFKAIATQMSLPFFKKLGFTVKKEFVNYFKVEKI
jgi:ribosomal protein S18 acetylase RimI-like enzyme